MLSKVKHSSLLKDVRYLLHRHHSPLVEVRNSYMPYAGNGVFVKRPIEKGRVLCLYPGIYTPGLPNAVESEYLARTTPPSGGAIEDNAYILNLQIPGGYIDGAALDGSEGRLDDNLSACGNIVNHSSDAANVEFMSFSYLDVFGEMIDADDTDIMSFPNEVRVDGSPWYLDDVSGEIVKFPSSNAGDNRSIDPLLFGAAFCSLRDLEEGTEVLFDYQLKGPPYPAWAQEWYK